ncbi:RidA family protein [Actinoplanes sp. NPDC051633]|uniref:RidA family protein n=1 Tax=Actinoplanes sp. NPDC051633 TaxID=3155670 RepID=UPI0034189463
MPEKFNPPTVHKPDGYSHVTISPAGRLIHFAGQCPLSIDDQVVGGDLTTQTDQVITNCLAVLAAASVSPADIVRSIVYVVSSKPSDLSAVWRQLLESPLAPAFSTASTLLGVTALGYEGQLVEVDLTAAAD